MENLAVMFLMFATLYGELVISFSVLDALAVNIFGHLSFLDNGLEFLFSLTFISDALSKKIESLGL